MRFGDVLLSHTMHYPLKLTNVFPGLGLYLPDPLQVRSVYEKQLLSEPDTPFPFWAKTWPSAFALASFLRDEIKWTEGKNVLELGAGTALPSFAVAPFADSVTISDHAPEAVALMKKNIAHLGLQNAHACLIDWNALPPNLEAGVLLLSDTNYAAGQFPSLLNLIDRFVNAGTTVILSTPVRINITPFAEAIRPLIKYSVLRTHSQPQEAVEIRILVLGK